MIRIERTSTVTQIIRCPEKRQLFQRRAMTRRHEVEVFTRYRMDGTRYRYGASARRRGGLWGARSSMFRSAS